MVQYDKIKIPARPQADETRSRDSRRLS